MSRTDKYQAAGHATMAKRGAHVGATDAIRVALKSGPANRSEIAKRTGLPLSVVNTIVGQLAGHIGGAVAIGGRGSATRYALFDSPEAHALREPARNIALPCRERVFKPLWRDPLVHMKLAMETRK